MLMVWCKCYQIYYPSSLLALYAIAFFVLIFSNLSSMYQVEALLHSLRELGLSVKMFLELLMILVHYILLK